MKTGSFDFELPEPLIATTPVVQRDNSRLLVLKQDGSIEHSLFSNIKHYLKEGDLLILNDSKVIPARLTGRKPTGGRIEILLIKEAPDGTFLILSRGRYTGRVSFDGGVEAELIEGRTARFNTSELKDFLWKHGKMPLPPYIKRKPDERDRGWYQTVYAEKEGSIAAPTAGFHFTERLLGEISARGVIIRRLTLHVGIGTFMQIKSVYLQDHRMEPEEFRVESGLIELVKRTREEGRRVFAVGTTTTRTIEALLGGHYLDCGLRTADCGLKKSEIRNPKSKIVRGVTDLFIYPGYRFRGVDCLITNFHLPTSTPLMLVSALAGRENILMAYREAIASGYRFFSYGDAMLIL